MNFLGVSIHSPEIGVCQPKVYGDIQSHHNMSSTLHILSSNSEGLHKWTFLFYIFIAVRKYHGQEFVI